ncbi:MAG TPA: hypothetical protein VG265_15465 [Gaiellaceae bacterium]|jgi:hypothetical protein|nr:hypothetical protein [Gaiellaceae bacterium]
MRTLVPSSAHAKVYGDLERRMKVQERRAWQLAAQRTLVFTIDGLGSTITVGVKGDVAVDFNCQIAGWRLLADQVGDLVVDVWKTDYFGFPGSVVNTIAAADLPTLSSDDKAIDTALPGWTTKVSAGDIFRFNVDSVSAVTRATLTLALQT